MRYLLIFLSFLALCPMGGCNRVRDLANISIDIPYSTQVSIPPYEDGEFPIPNQGYTATVGPFEIATNSRQYIKDHNTSAEKIVSITLKQLQVKLLQPTTETLDFMDTIRVYMSADGLPEFMAAYYYGRPTGDVVELTCSDMDLKQYFLKDMIQVTMKGNFNRTVKPGTTFEVNSVFHMVANPLR
jgi:hypothetical protein